VDRPGFERNLQNYGPDKRHYGERRFNGVEHKKLNRCGELRRKKTFLASDGVKIWRHEIKVDGFSSGGEGYFSGNGNFSCGGH
jgi:hypothetical protein